MVVSMADLLVSLWVESVGLWAVEMAASRDLPLGVKRVARWVALLVDSWVALWGFC